MIVGHENVKKLFSYAVKRGTLAHAYLFYGPEGIGKKSFAVDLAKSLNNSKGLDADFKFIDENTSDKTYSISIEEIRGLKRFFSFKSYANPWRIAVVDNAHLMQTDAQNSLLKLLEEPGSRSLIILIAHDPNSVLEVIKSRCQLVSFKPLSREAIGNLLMSRGLRTEDLDFVISVANGRPGLALKLAEGKIPEIRGEVENFKKLRKLPLYARFDYAKKLVLEERVDTALHYWIGYLRESLEENRELLQEALKLNNIISQSSFNKRLALENFFLHV